MEAGVPASRDRHFELALFLILFICYARSPAR